MLTLLGAVAATTCSVRTARAIDPQRTMSQYVHQRWGTESGFPRGPVYSIDQTKDGYLWIGTEKGLVRFDGQSFQLMQAGGPEQPALSHVLGLVADPDGSLWARLRRPGMTLLRYESGSFRDVMSDFATRGSVSAMTRARDGSLLLWVLEKDQASAILRRDNKFESIASPSEFSNSAVLAMAQTSNGDIWLGTRDAGLFRLRGGDVAAINDGLPDLKVNALAPAANGDLWIGTDAGVVCWNGTQLTKAGVPAALNGIQALAMSIDRDANLWVGTNSGGLLRVNAQGVATLGESNRGVADAVTAVFEDREGNLWVGSAGGLERLRDSAFVTYSQPEGLPADGNNPVFVDSENRMWFGPAGGGLWWLKEGKRSRVSNAGLDKDVAYSITGAKDELWVGRQRGGLTHLRFEHGSVTARTYTQAQGLAQDSVYSVFRSPDGTVWAGTLSGGVSKFSGGRFTNYTTANGLSSNSVHAILQSSDGTMWFAGPVGISALSKSQWTTYTTKDGLPAEEITCLLEDSTGTLWMGSTAGLAFRSAGRFQLPDRLPALLREPILGLAEDQHGSFWIATSSRVLRVNREKLRHGGITDGDLREYGLADGLRGVEGVKRFRSVVTDAAGRIWFSLNCGISVVDPARQRSNSAPAIVHVQSILADGAAIALHRAVHIPGGRQRITFGFAGLSLSVPERVRFRYRLDGYDHAWSEPTAAREAAYTNLPPSAYRFRVVASNPDGVWSSTEAAIRLEVDPLVWQTWWFRTSSVIGLGLAGLALYRLRVHQVTRQLNLRFDERLAERTRIAQELHDTLLQGFLSASMQVHVAADQLPPESKVKPTLVRALQLMRQVIEEGRNAVRGLRSTTSCSLDLEQAFSRIQEESVPQSGAEVAFRVIVSGTPRPLHPLLRDEAYQIGREALINAFRHARANKIELEIVYSTSHLRILVRDDGRGIDAHVLESGVEGHWGLTGMRERADRIGARFRVWSRPHGGTEIELSVPSQMAFEDHRMNALGWLRKHFGRRVRPMSENRKGAANERSG